MKCNEAMHKALEWVSKYDDFYLVGSCIKDFDLEILKYRMG